MNYGYPGAMPYGQGGGMTQFAPQMPAMAPGTGYGAQMQTNFQNTTADVEAQRKRLKALINELTLPEGVGVIVRTAGEGKKTRYFVRDLHILLKKWEEITTKMMPTRASSAKSAATATRRTRNFRSTSASPRPSS